MYVWPHECYEVSKVVDPLDYDLRCIKGGGDPPPEISWHEVFYVSIICLLNLVLLNTDYCNDLEINENKMSFSLDSVPEA